MAILSVVIDIALVAVFVGAIIKGRKNGFVKMILSIIAAIVAILIAKEYCEPVSLWIEENLIRNAAINSIANVLSFNIGGTIQNAVDSMPDYILNAAEYAGVEIESFVSGVITTETVGTATNAIYSAVKDFAIIPAAKIVAFFVIYAIANAVLSIGISFINKIFKLPILKGLNRLLGAVIGGIKGFFEIYIISAAVGFLSMLIPDHEITQAITNTVIQNALWENILNFLK